MRGARFVAGGAWVFASIAAVASFLNDSSRANGLVAGLLPLVLFLGVVAVLAGTYVIGRIFDALEKYFERDSLESGLAFSRADNGFLTPHRVSTIQELETLRIVYASYGFGQRDHRPLNKSEVIILDSFSACRDLIQAVDGSLSVTTSFILGARVKGVESRAAPVPSAKNRQFSIATWSI